MTAHASRNRGAALLSVGSNAALTVAKLVLGLVTGSIAVLSEAAHSASDLVASLIALVSVRASARPPDADHPYGHGKHENLGASLEGLLILGAGLAVAIESLRRLVGGGAAIDHVELAIAVMAGSALVNLLISARLRRVARQTGSPAIEGDAAHLTADVWTSGGAALGLILVALTGWQPLDAIAALAVSAYICWMGGRLTWRAIQTLLDRNLPPAELETIEDVLDDFAHDGVSFHALRARRGGSTRYIDLHMVVPPQTTVERGHALSGQVKSALRKEIPEADVLIHLEDH